MPSPMQGEIKTDWETMSCAYRTRVEGRPDARARGGAPEGQRMEITGMVRGQRKQLPSGS
jgi:hypothetical protein